MPVVCNVGVGQKRRRGSVFPGLIGALVSYRLLLAPGKPSTSRTTGRPTSMDAVVVLLANCLHEQG